MPNKKKYRKISIHIRVIEQICTLMRSRYNYQTGEVDHFAVVIGAPKDVIVNERH